MKENDKTKDYFSNLEELSEAEKEYAECLHLKVADFPNIKHPSLVYCLHSWRLWEVFARRIDDVIKELNVLKENISKYKGDKVKVNEEIQKLDNKISELKRIKQESDDNYEFYKHYLVSLAKRSDALGTEHAKNIYLNASEEIIKSLINYYIKNEKNFLIINDNINKLNNILNI